MTEHSSGPGRDNDWNRSYGSSEQYPGEQYPGEQYYGSGSSGSSRSGSGGSGYGASGQGAVRPGPATPGQGGAGPGMPTNPIWQAAPGQGSQGRGAPPPAGPGLGAPPPAGSPPPGGQPAMLGAPRAADAKGFLASLFDFSFTSFVTTKIIKVVYVLVFILTLIGAFLFTVSAFNASALFGLLTLIIGDPLLIIIGMAFWRLVLESFVVMFRIAEDIHSIRERGSGLR